MMGTYVLYMCNIYSTNYINMHGNTQFLYIGVDIYKHSVCVELHVFVCCLLFQAL